MSEKNKNEYLLSVIGEIDDKFIVEAAEYKKKRKKLFIVPVLAACLSLFFVLVVTLPLAVMLSLDGGLLDLPNLEGEEKETVGGVGDGGLENIPQESVNAGMDEELENAPGAAQPYGKLDLLLNEQKDEEKYQKLDSAEELSYVGRASLVWQYEEGGEIYVAELTSAQLASLQSYTGSGTQVGKDSPAIAVSVWVLDGKGNVSTPYLKTSRGNLGCEIFDYEAEIIPDERLVDCISDIFK